MSSFFYKMNNEQILIKSGKFLYIVIICLFKHSISHSKMIWDRWIHLPKCIFLIKHKLSHTLRDSPIKFTHLFSKINKLVQKQTLGEIMSSN